MDLLVIINKNKLHYVYIKDFNRFICNKTKCKSKKHFCRYCLQGFSSERVLVEHKEVCLWVNGKQTVKLRSGSSKFKNYVKQIAAPFKICADFECNVKRVKSSDRGYKGDNTSYTGKYQDHIPCSFAYKVLFDYKVLLMINLVSLLFFTEEEIQSINSSKQFLKSITIVKM